jgi:hypothetical protein
MSITLSFLTGSRRFWASVAGCTQSSLKNNFTFWTPIHPVRQTVQKLGISRYMCIRALPAGRPNAQLPNLFFREPLAEGFSGHTTVLGAQLTIKK